MKTGKYQQLNNSSLCNSLCAEKKACCDKLASCSCGTHTGHFACLCPAGYYGSGLANSCKCKYVSSLEFGKCVTAVEYQRHKEDRQMYFLYNTVKESERDNWNAL